MTMFVLICFVWATLPMWVRGTLDYSRNGDIIVAALLPISKGDNCQGENPAGILQAEAVIKKITQHYSREERNYTLGYEIRDTCSDPRIAVQAAFTLVKTQSGRNRSREEMRQKIVAVIIDGSNATIRNAIKGMLDAYELAQILIGPQDPIERSSYHEITKQSKALSELFNALDYSWVDMLAAERVGVAPLLKSELKRRGTCIVSGLIPRETYHADVNSGEPTQDKKYWENFGRANLAVVMSSVDRAIEVIEKARYSGTKNKNWVIVTDIIKPYPKLQLLHPNETILVLSKDFPITSPEELLEFRQFLTTMDDSKRPWKIKPLASGILSDWSRYLEAYPCHSSSSKKSLISSLNNVARIFTIVSSLQSMLDEVLCGPVLPCKATLNPEVIMDLSTKLKSHYTRYKERHLKHSCRNAKSYKLTCHNEEFMLRKAQWNYTCGTTTLIRVGQWRNNSGWEIDPSELSTLKKSRKAWKCQTGQAVRLPFYWDHCQQQACLTCPMDSQAGNKESCRLCTAIKCSDIPLAYVRFPDPFALIITCLCVVGEIFVLLVVVIFTKFRSTPVVKSSNRMFNFLTLSTLGFWFAVVPIFLGRPNHWSCNAIVSSFFLLYATVGSILLSKTVRLLLIFKSMRQPSKWLGNASFFANTMAFIFIQAFLCVLNYLLYPVHPKTTFHHEVVLLHCGRTSSPVLALGFIYNCLLTGLCGYFAYKVRKLPQNFNEAKFMSFAIFSYTTSWIVVLAGYYDKNCTAQQTAIISLGLAIGAFSVLGFLFFPKVWVMLFYPQLNTKSATIEGARRYSIDASVTIVGARATRSRSSTLELPQTSRAAHDHTQIGATDSEGRPRGTSDCSFIHLVAEERPWDPLARWTDTGLSESPGSGKARIPVSAPSSPV